MSKYGELPPMEGAEKKIIKKCSFCGQIFNSIFEEADHLLEKNETSFDPKFILTAESSIRMGNLLRTFYANAHKREVIKDLAEEVYSLLYLAETDPEMVDFTLDMLIDD